MKRNLFRVLAGLFLGVLSVMSLSSCSKNIVGKWQSTNITHKMYEAGKFVPHDTEMDILIDSLEYNEGFNFKSDGTGEHFIGLGALGVSDTTQITWELIGDKLMIVSDDGTLAYDVISISGSLMVLEATEGETDGGIKRERVVTYNFKKI